MPTPGQEIASLDFENLIGGPLVAVVHAQAQAAIATVGFIKQVGFVNDSSGAVLPGQPQRTGKPTMVTFTYDKSVPKSDGSGDEAKTVELTVPFLSMLPIPYLRVDNVEVEFNAKINSIQFTQTDSKFNVSTEGDAAGWQPWGAARLKTSISYQRKTKEGSTVTRDYSMGVKVKAVQEEMPGGLERVLSILESLIKENQKT